MNATTLLLRKLHRIGDLLLLLERDPDCRTEVMSETIDCVMDYFALEEDVVLPVAASTLGANGHALRATHVMARIALFRVVTQTRREVFAREVRTLREAFRAHALSLAAVLNGLAASVTSAA